MDRTVAFRWSVVVACGALLVQGPRDAAAWQHIGNPVCVAPGAQHDPICILPWIAWTDERDGVPQAYALELDWRTGLVFDSPANGLHIAPSTTAQSDLVAVVHNWDGALYAAWAEDRSLGTGMDVYIQRIIDGAPAPGWPVDGLRIASAAGDQRHPRLLEGYRMGADWFHPVPLVFVTWEDARSGSPALYATAIDSGSVTSPGWVPGGEQVSAGTDPVVNVGLVQRGLGAVAVSEQSGSVFAQALSLDGVVPADPSFPAGGRQLSEVGVTASHAAVAEDDRACVLVAWEEEREGHTQIRMQGWRDSTNVMFGPAAIRALDDTLARPSELRVYPYAYNVMRVLWRDQRADAGDIYVRDVYLPSIYGCCFFDPGPGVDGAPFVFAPGRQSNLSTQVGGFWEDARSGVPQIYAYYGWPFDTPSGGPMAATGASQTQPSASYTIGGYIPEDPPAPVVVWTDMRNAATGPDIYAQVMGSGPGALPVPPGGPPARVALSNARPTPSRGGVSFTLELPKPARTQFVVTDIAGRIVRSLGSTERSTGRQVIEWDGRTLSGARAAPGLYWLRGLVDDQPIDRRIVLLGD